MKIQTPFPNAQTNRQVRTALYLLLAFACCCPYNPHFYDGWGTPKWFLAGGTACLLVLWTCIRRVCRMRHTEEMPQDNRHGHLADMGLAVTMVAAAESLYTLFLYATHPAASRLGAAGTFDNPAGAAFFLCTALPFIRLWGGLQTGRLQKLLAGTALCLAAAATLSTHSRTGAACLVLYLIIYVCTKPQIPGWIKWSLPGILIALTAAFVLTRKQASTSGRLFILERTWELIAEKPWTGHGTGGFIREYMARQGAYFHAYPDDPRAMLADETWHPLNEFARLWTDYGILAPVLLAALLGCLTFTLSKSNAPGSRGMACALVPLWLFALSSYPFKYPAAWLVVVACLFQTIRTRQGLFPSLPRKAAWTFCGLGMAASLTGLTLLAREYRYEKEWAAVSRLALRGQSREMMPRYARLYGHYRHRPTFLYNYASELFYADEGEKALHMARACRRHWSSYNLSLLTGDICRDLGKHAEAAGHYQTAYDMCPARFAPLEGLYYAYKNLGDTVRAGVVARLVQRKKVKVPSPEVERIRREIVPDGQPTDRRNAP